MCGIVGVSGLFDPLEITQAVRVIRHRGPDDSGTFFDEEAQIGLGHARLSIIDLSPLGRQPMLSDDGKIVVVFNGEIYNFCELRTQLISAGASFRGHSDTEVLLNLYRFHGEAMLRLLSGIFALAIYDKDRHTLLLACDPAGVKPLYFCKEESRFVFASELKALMVLDKGRRALNLISLYRTLGFLWGPDGATPFEGVRRLGPGDAMRVENGRLIRHWHWARSAWEEEPLAVDASAAVRRLRESLRAAVHRQMVADVPVGAFLSGGLDSSAVVAMAREVSSGIECFTIDTGPVRDSGVTDDLPYARRVAKHLGVKLHEVRVDHGCLASELEQMVAQLDEPLADPAPLNVLYISRLARQHGVKVLLSGAGGDDIFGGYRRHRALMLERYWGWLPTVIRKMIQEATSRFRFPGSFGRRVGKAFAHAGLTADQRLMGYFLWADPARMLGLFAKEHRFELTKEQMIEPLAHYLRTLPPGLPPLQRMLALEQRFFLADHNLLYTDKMSMAAGVEVRVPLLDDELVKFANRLPAKFKQHGTQGKWILKKAMEPYLPCDVIYRPKTGFGAPLRRWLHHELKEWVEDILSPETLKRRGLFDPLAVAGLIASDRAGRIDAAYTIFGLICIEVWCREFMDKAWVKDAKYG